VPIWDSSDVLITIIGKRHHRPEPAHGIIFGHASRRWLRFRAGNNKGLAGIPQPWQSTWEHADGTGRFLREQWP